MHLFHSEGHARRLKAVKTVAGTLPARRIGSVYIAPRLVFLSSWSWTGGVISSELALSRHHCKEAPTDAPYKPAFRCEQMNLAPPHSQSPRPAPPRRSNQ